MIAYSYISSAEMSMMVKTGMALPTKVAEDMPNLLVGMYVTVDLVLVFLTLKQLSIGNLFVDRRIS